jgi:hypothetical protein
MRKLKIVSPGFHNYTGVFGMTEFKDGVSVHYVDPRTADRLAAGLKMEWIDDEGQAEAAGPSQTLVNRGLFVGEVQKLERATEEALIEERLRLAEKSGVSVVNTFYTREQLEGIVDGEGLPGLREVAAPWGVKGRAIPDLIERILEAQTKHAEKIKYAVGEERMTSETVDPASKAAEEIVGRYTGRTVGKMDEFSEPVAEETTSEKTAEPVAEPVVDTIVNEAAAEETASEPVTENEVEVGKNT